MSRGKDFLLGAVVGGLVGAAVALMLAPKPGKEFRKDVQKGLEVVKSKGKEVIEAVLNSEQVQGAWQNVQANWIELKRNDQ
jgi:gas vesicle protein